MDLPEALALLTFEERRMLVVSRKPGERLLIGEAVEVTVLEISGDQVRLGVSAPREVPIHREELLERIRRENIRAAVLGSEQLHAMGAHLRNNLSPPTPATGSPDHVRLESASPTDTAEAARAS